MCSMYLYVHSTAVYLEALKCQVLLLGAEGEAVNKTDKLLSSRSLHSGILGQRRQTFL